MREAKLRVNNQNSKYFDTKLRFARLASLRSAILIKFKSSTNWSLYPQRLIFFEIEWRELLSNIFSAFYFWFYAPRFHFYARFQLESHCRLTSPALLFSLDHTIRCSSVFITRYFRFIGKISPSWTQGCYSPLPKKFGCFQNRPISRGDLQPYLDPC